MLEASMQLLTSLNSKPRLNETEFKLAEALSAYIEIHIRAATKLTVGQLIEEGLIDDLEGSST